MREVTWISDSVYNSKEGTIHRTAVTVALCKLDVFDYATSKPTTGPHMGAVLVRAIDTWIEYAKAHRLRWDSGIGDDYYAGPLWYHWGDALHQMLSCYTGDLHCGTLSSIIVHNLKEEGFDL